MNSRSFLKVILNYNIETLEIYVWNLYSLDDAYLTEFSRQNDKFSKKSNDSTMQNLKFKTKLDRSGFEDRCEYILFDIVALKMMIMKRYFRIWIVKRRK